MLTGAAKDKIGKFTELPEIGIYNYEQIRFQIVDMPALMEDAALGVGNGKEILAQIRACDLLCLCIDLSRDYHSQMSMLLEELTKADIRINVPPPPIEIQKTGSNKIQVFFLTKEAQEYMYLTEEIKEIIRETGIRNAIVKVYGRINLDQVIDVISPSMVYLDTIIFGTKGDLSHTENSFLELQQAYSDKFPIIIGISIPKKEFPTNFGEIVLNFLKKIKVFTMNAGRVAEKPLVMDENCTVKDVALRVHKSFYELFDYAIVIRESAKQRKKRVGIDYVLNDNDIIELHSI